MELLESVQSVLEVILKFAFKGMVVIGILIFWYIAIGMAVMCLFDPDSDTPLRIVTGFILFILIPYLLIHTFFFFKAMIFL